MTRSSLLYVLDNTTALGPDEERELEQLAQAFPYCQTAHLLLAKIAHDRGTMLAGQRLRRAATYAADRALLRRLIEQVPEAAEPASVAVDAPASPAEQPETAAPTLAEAPPAAREQPIEEAPVVAETPAPPSSEVVVPNKTEPIVNEPQPSVSSAPLVTAPEPVPLEAVPAPVITPAVPAETPAPVIQTEEMTPASPSEVVSEAEMPATPVVELAETSLPTTQPEAPENLVIRTVKPSNADELISEITFPASDLAAVPVAGPVMAIVPEALAGLAGTLAGEPAAAQASVIEPIVPAAAPIADEAAPDATSAEENIKPNTAEAVTPVVTVENAAATEDLTAEPAQDEADAITEPDAAVEPELPAAAPPIRPPDESGVARFEFGLQPEPPVQAPAYELPLIDEWAAAATTLALKGKDLPDEKPAESFESDQPTVRTEAAFTGDAAVGYALAEGSRLGYGLGLLEMAVLAKLDAENGSAGAASAGAMTTEGHFSADPAAPPVQALPPAGEFFEPDALLEAHWATHRPPAPLLPSSLDLINNFLRRQPRLTRPAMLPPSPSAQADLSTRSTRTEPDLASESLARILARQGKTARAIEIYERLMVKQPEKMAYFAAQIQQLQPPA